MGFQHRPIASATLADLPKKQRATKPFCLQTGMSLRGSFIFYDLSSMSPACRPGLRAHNPLYLPINPKECPLSISFFHWLYWIAAEGFQEGIGMEAISLTVHLSTLSVKPYPRPRLRSKRPFLRSTAA